MVTKIKVWSVRIDGSGGYLEKDVGIIAGLIKEMVEVGTCCPFDARSWKGCMEDDCENKYAECWERYFLEKAKEG